VVHLVERLSGDCPADADSWVLRPDSADGFSAAPKSAAVAGDSRLDNASEKNQVACRLLE
jgi:hypothetical protein